MEDALPFIKSLTAPFIDLGVKVGAHQSCPIPSHKDDKPSFSTSTDRGSVVFKCFGCGAKGTIIDLYQAIFDVDMKEAISMLKEKYVTNQSDLGSARSPEPQKAPERIRMVRPASVPMPTHVETPRGRSHLFDGKLEHLNIEDADIHVTAGYYPNRGVRGFATFRWDEPTGKIMRQGQYIDGIWHGRKVEKDLVPPIFKAQEILENKDSLVIVVEGEKCMDRLQAELVKYQHRREIPTGVIVTTNLGGAGYPEKSDWSPLYGRKVLLFPDNDSNGEQWAHKLGALLHKKDTAVGMVRLYTNITDKDKGFDIVDWLDAGNSVERIFNFQTHSPWLSEEEPFDTGPVEFRVGDRLFYTLGKRCNIRFEGETEGDPAQNTFIGRNMWPVSVYRKVETGEMGVRLRIVTLDRKVLYPTIPASAFISKQLGKAESARLASLGAQISVDSNHHLAHAMGKWAEMMNPTIDNLIQTPGWHENYSIYVNGKTIVGTKNWHADEEHMHIKERSTRRGRAIDWLRAAEQLCTTPMLRIAVGLSLAGPMIRPLEKSSSILHVFGPSSCGKTTWAAIAASIWGHRKKTQKSWNQTINGLELSAEIARDACLVLDEVGRWRGSSNQFANAVHDLTSAQGRVRASRTGDAKPIRAWGGTICSTGEVPMTAMYGDLEQGGLKVRSPEVEVEPGDITLNALHSEQCYKMTSLYYGAIGDLWVNTLSQVPLDVMFRRAEKFTSRRPKDPEMTRIMLNLSVIGAALSIAHERGLLPWDDDQIHKDLEYLIERIDSNRVDFRSPNERCLELLMATMETEPYRFPDADSDRMPQAQIYGFRKTVRGGGIYLLTTERMLSRSGVCLKAGTTPRAFINWSERMGHCERTEGRERIAGKQGRWKRFRVLDPYIRDVSREYDAL